MMRRPAWQLVGHYQFGLWIYRYQVKGVQTYWGMSEPFRPSQKIIDKVRLPEQVSWQKYGDKRHQHIYNKILQSLTTEDKKLVFRMKNKGPGFDPCGTPHLQQGLRPSFDLIFTCWVRSCKDSSHHNRVLPVIPRVVILLNKHPWWTVSLAFLISRKLNQRIAISL